MECMAHSGQKTNQREMSLILLSFATLRAVQKTMEGGLDGRGAKIHLKNSSSADNEQQSRLLITATSAVARESLIIGFSSSHNEIMVISFF